MHGGFIRMPCTDVEFTLENGVDGGFQTVHKYVMATVTNYCMIILICIHTK